MSDSTSPERGARVRIPPPLAFVACIGLGALAQWAVAPARLPVDRALRIGVGVGLIALAVALLGAARRWFVRTGQNPAPWKPSPELILAGPYRFTRNPMYLAMTTFQVGLGIALDNLWISGLAFVALAVVHFAAVRPEERYLTEKFGDSYKQYLAKVRRYL